MTECSTLSPLKQGVYLKRLTAVTIQGIKRKSASRNGLADLTFERLRPLSRERHRRSSYRGGNHDERGGRSGGGERAHHEFAAPPRADHGRGRLGQRFHDASFEILRRAHAAAPIDFDIDLLPEFHVAPGVTLAHACFRKLTIQPRVQCRREHASVLLLLAKRHFSIGERTLLFGAARSAMMVAVEPAKAVVGAEIVYH
jgi:hypothetical protein